MITHTCIADRENLSSPTTGLGVGQTTDSDDEVDDEDVGVSDCEGGEGEGEGEGVVSGNLSTGGGGGGEAGNKFMNKYLSTQGMTRHWALWTSSFYLVCVHSACDYIS